MSQNILDKNMKRMEKYYLEDIEKIKRNIQVGERVYNVIYDKIFSSNPVLSVIDGEKKWNLTSQYENERLIEEWAENIKLSGSQCIINIFGLGDGRYVEKLLSRTEQDVYIIVYEPSIDIFLKVIENIELKILNSKRVGIIVKDMNEAQFEMLQLSVVGYHNISHNQYLCHLNYDTIFDSEYLEYLEVLKRVNKNLVAGYNTQIKFKDSATSNHIANIRYICEQYSVEQLEGILPEGVPAVIISAGPSLEKNMSQLKKAKDHAILIATDTALKPILNAGIVPDVFVTIDPQKPLSLFQHDRIKKIPMVISDAGNKALLDSHKEKCFFSYDGNKFIQSIYQLCNEVHYPLNTGGSVANNAFSLGKLMGARTIILVGQDLSAEGDRMHVKGAFESEEEAEKYAGNLTVEVDGVDGHKVKTRVDLQMYLEWFEEQIQKNRDIKVIDATEGGALIKGSQLMRLEDAIREECNKEKICIQELLERMDVRFDKDKRDKIAAYMEGIPKRLKRLEKKVIKGIMLYKQLETLFRAQSLDRDKIKKLQKQIKQISNYIDNEEIVALLDCYLCSEQCKALMISGKKYHDSRNDGKEVVENAILLLEAILKAIEILNADIQEMVDSFK